MLKTVKFGLDATGSFAMAIDGIEQLTLYASANGTDWEEVNLMLNWKRMTEGRTIISR